MWLLIGYGSTLHSDDGLAHVLIDRLQSTKLNFDLSFISGTQLNIEWAQAIAAASGVIFVDASKDLLPGEISFNRLQDTDSCADADNSSFTHHLTPQILVALARQLFNACPPVWLCTVGGESFALGESLSPTVENALADLVDLIIETPRVNAG